MFYLLSSLSTNTIGRYLQFVNLKELPTSSFTHSQSKNEMQLQQHHDDNSSDTMCRYFATQLSVIGREGNTKSICYIMLFCCRSIQNIKKIVEFYFWEFLEITCR